MKICPKFSPRPGIEPRSAHLQGKSATQYTTGHLSTLYDLYKQRDELKRYADQGVRGNTAKCKIMCKAKHVEVEEALNKWFSAQRADGKPMSWEMVITKAKKFYKISG